MHITSRASNQSDGMSGVGVQGAGVPTDKVKESSLTGAIDGGAETPARAPQEKVAEAEGAQGRNGGGDKEAEGRRGAATGTLN